MAPHSSTLAWKIPWMEEPGRLQSMGSLRVRHDWVTSLSLFTFMHWRRKWRPTPVFLPGESQGQEAWWAAVYGVAQSRTRLKWLSSSSRSSMLLSTFHLYSNGTHKKRQIFMWCTGVRNHRLSLCQCPSHWKTTIEWEKQFAKKKKILFFKTIPKFCMTMYRHTCMNMYYVWIWLCELHYVLVDRQYYKNREEGKQKTNFFKG